MRRKDFLMQHFLFPPITHFLGSLSTRCSTHGVIAVFFNITYVRFLIKRNYSSVYTQIRMEVSQKPVCRYGIKCYRKNQDHMKEFFHPPDVLVKEDEEKEKEVKKNLNLKNVNPVSRSERSAKSKDIQAKDGGRKVRENKRLSDSKEKNLKLKKVKTQSEETDSGVTTSLKTEVEGPLEDSVNKDSSDSDSNEDDVKSNSWTYIKVSPDANKAPREKPPQGTSNKEKIKYYYLVDMPPDFYSFYQFCESIDVNEPLNALKGFGLKLVGPYDILGGSEINVAEKEAMLCHWRYFYDPPEFQTLIASESGFHIGYWRDSPQELPVFVASNNSQDCIFKVEGENLYGAVHNYLIQYMKNSDPFTKTKVAKFQTTLSKWAGKENYTLDKITTNIKNRQKRINSKTFHGVGIVVPVEEKTEVGYRPLIETDANLRKICKLIMDADDDTERDAFMEKLQPLINFANIANDECDFGNCLELGIDLFCMGSSVFDSFVEHLLTTAYTLLNRSEFGDIIKAHLKNRRKGTNLSVLLRSN